LELSPGLAVTNRLELSTGLGGDDSVGIVTGAWR